MNRLAELNPSALSPGRYSREKSSAKKSKMRKSESTEDSDATDPRAYSFGEVWSYMEQTDCSNPIKTQFRGEALIGRRPDLCEIAVSNNLVSRKHAKLSLGPLGDLYLENISKNPNSIHLNSVAIEPGEKVIWKKDEELRIFDCCFRWKPHDWYMSQVKRQWLDEQGSDTVPECPAIEEREDQEVEEEIVFDDAEQGQMDLDMTVMHDMNFEIDEVDEFQSIADDEDNEINDVRTEKSHSGNEIAGSIEIHPEVLLSPRVSIAKIKCAKNLMLMTGTPLPASDTRAPTVKYMPATENRLVGPSGILKRRQTTTSRPQASNCPELEVNADFRKSMIADHFMVPTESSMRKQRSPKSEKAKVHDGISFHDHQEMRNLKLRFPDIECSKNIAAETPGYFVRKANQRKSEHEKKVDDVRKTILAAMQDDFDEISSPVANLQDASGSGSEETSCLNFDSTVMNPEIVGNLSPESAEEEGRNIIQEPEGYDQAPMALDEKDISTSKPLEVSSEDDIVQADKICPNEQQINGPIADTNVQQVKAVAVDLSIGLSSVPAACEICKTPERAIVGHTLKSTSNKAKSVAKEQPRARLQTPIRKDIENYFLRSSCKRKSHCHAENIYPELRKLATPLKKQIHHHRVQTKRDESITALDTILDQEDLVLSPKKMSVLHERRLPTPLKLDIQLRGINPMSVSSYLRLQTPLKNDIRRFCRAELNAVSVKNSNADFRDEILLPDPVAEASKSIEDEAFVGQDMLSADGNNWFSSLLRGKPYKEEIEQALLKLNEQRKQEILDELCSHLASLIKLSSPNSLEEDVYFTPQTFGKTPLSKILVNMQKPWKGEHIFLEAAEQGDPQSKLRTDINDYTDVEEENSDSTFESDEEGESSSGDHNLPRLDDSSPTPSLHSRPIRARRGTVKSKIVLKSPMTGRTCPSQVRNAKLAEAIQHNNGEEVNQLHGAHSIKLTINGRRSRRGTKPSSKTEAHLKSPEDDKENDNSGPNIVEDIKPSRKRGVNADHPASSKAKTRTGGKDVAGAASKRRAAPKPTGKDAGERPTIRRSRRIATLK